MIILRQKEYGNAGVYIKRTLKGIGTGAMIGSGIGGISTGLHPVGFIGGAAVGGTLGGIIGGATAKFHTPEYKEKERKREEEERKIFEKVWKDYKLNKLEGILTQPSIQKLIKEADCRGWDDYIYVNIYIDHYPYFSSFGKEENKTADLAEFGNIDDYGILRVFKNGDVYFGDKKVTPQTFKPTLLKYQQELISRWEKDYKKEGEECGCNQKFIDLQKEIHNLTRRTL